MCRSYPASSFPCQGYQSHAFVIGSEKEQTLTPQSCGESLWCHTAGGDRGITGLQQEWFQEQHPYETCHSLIDIFGDSFNLGRCLQKNKKGMKEVDFISLHYSFQEDIFDQLSNVNAPLVVR